MDVVVPLHCLGAMAAWPGHHEPVAADVQGKISLVTHFQNSSLLHEDKRCRPILFNSNGEVAGEQEPFPVGPNMRVRSSKTGLHQGHRPEVQLNAPEMWQNTERGKELMLRGMRVDLDQ